MASSPSFGSYWMCRRIMRRVFPRERPLLIIPGLLRCTQVLSGSELETISFAGSLTSSSRPSSSTTTPSSERSPRSTGIPTVIEEETMCSQFPVRRGTGVYLRLWSKYSRCLNTAVYDEVAGMRAASTRREQPCCRARGRVMRHRSRSWPVIISKARSIPTSRARSYSPSPQSPTRPHRRHT